MSVLDIKSRTQWAAYLRGDVEPKISKAMAIGEIFKKVGVTDFTSHVNPGGNWRSLSM